MRSLLLALAFILAPAALAQPALPTGDWTGTIEWRDAEPVALTAALEECAEGLKLTLRSADGAYRTEEVVHVEGGEVHFGVANTARDYRLSCAAARQDDGTYAGTCRAGNGARARLRLQPPAQSTIGCSE
jgi:hypothetical protein